MKEISLVFATQNKNKLKEVQAQLPPHIKLLGLHDIGCFEELEETGDRIMANAFQKAEYVYQKYGYNCFADDTGLEVKALNGDPGVYSARYAGPQCNSEDNMTKLLKNMEGIVDRTARFKTVIALIVNGAYWPFTGICDGQIIHERRGEKGFGYDPIFLPNGYDQTFAEMPLEEKTKIGHRGKAVAQLVEYLSENAVNF